MEIKYLQGDATDPQGQGIKFICHICNDMGGWGKGFVIAISKRWPKPEEDYRNWHKHRDDNDFALGSVRFVEVAPEIYVVNMVGQHKVGFQNNVPPIRYEAVQECLAKVAEKALEMQASVHMPRIGCGLAGGKWEEIEKIINGTLIQNNIPTFVYDFQP